MKLSDELLTDLKAAADLAEVASTPLWLKAVADTLESIARKIRADVVILQDAERREKEAGR